MLYDEDLERAVICAVIEGGVDAREAVNLVASKHFYLVRHRMIWDAVCELVERGEPVDPVTLATALKSKMRDAANYLGELLMSTVAAPQNFAHYAEELRVLAWKREVARGLREVLSTLEDESPVTVSARLKSLAEFPSTEKSENRYADFLKWLESERESYPTPVDDLNFLLNGGLMRGQMVVVAGRPGHGKTAFALGCAHIAADAGKRVTYHTYEMSARELIGRLVASMTGVPYRYLVASSLTAEEWELVSAATEELSRKPLAFRESDIDLEEFLAYECSTGSDLVIVDYIQMMRAESGKSRNEELAHISRALKRLAIERDKAVLVLSQLNRAIEARNEKRPVLADLRDCGSIEQDADAVIFLVRPALFGEAHDPEFTEVYLSKHRNGPTGKVNARFIASRYAFQDWTR